MAHVQNLGAIGTTLINAVRSAYAAHEDLAAFHAPAECGDLVEAGIQRHWRAMVEKLEGDTGLPAEGLVAEFETRCGGKFLYVTDLLRPLEDVIQQRENEDRIERRERAFGCAA